MPAATDVVDAIAACRESHRRLWESVTGLDDGGARRPSLLPGWSVGHVLTHVARNADALARVLHGAAAGDQVAMYPDGPEGRQQDIETGAGRPAADILGDLRTATSALEATMAGLPDHAWAGSGRGTYGAVIPCAVVPEHRRREVEVHHADLGLGYTPADWPGDFVDTELPLAVAGMAARLTVGRERAAVLAWLLGRAPMPTDLTLGPWAPGQAVDRP